MLTKPELNIDRYYTLKTIPIKNNGVVNWKLLWKNEIFT